MTVVCVPAIAVAAGDIFDARKRGASARRAGCEIDGKARGLIGEARRIDPAPADQLLKIILNNKISNDLDNCILNCISINVANTLKRLKWKKIKIFSPGEEELSLL